MNYTVEETKIYIICPSCGTRDASCGHISNDTAFGPWYCDSCGTSYKGGRDSDGNFYVKKGLERKYDLLAALGNREGGIILFVDGSQFLPIDAPEFVIDHEHMQYYYNEHTCPTNYLRVKGVVDMLNMDNDPHGLFRYLGAIPYVEPDDYSVKELLKIFIDAGNTEVNVFLEECGHDKI